MRPTWVRRSIEELVRQFCSGQGNAAWIGVKALDGLAGRSSGGLWRRGGRYEVWPDLPLPKGFVWRPDSAGAPPELWLDPRVTGYRPVFERFAQRYLGASGLTGADVQIDHVFPKGAAALAGLAYVRMLAIPPASNMAAGRTLEKAMAARAAANPRRKPTRMATYFSIGKATGFVGWERLPDSNAGLNRELASALITHLRAFGLPADVLSDLDRGLIANTATIIS